MEKESIMERYAVLLEEAGSAECQEALNDRDFGVAHERVRERHFLSTFYMKMIILPRQARDKHSKNSSKGPFSCSIATLPSSRRAKR
eukprot:COSAG01_NODE_59995_length_297_cov_0.611111_1_plen_86_part_01